MTSQPDVSPSPRPASRPLLSRLRLLPPAKLQSLSRRVAIGVAYGVIAIVVRLPLEPVLSGSLPFVFFLPAVTVAAVRSGVAGAVSAGLVCMTYLLVSAPFLSQFRLSAGLPFLLFVLSSVLVTATAEELRKALNSLRKQDAEHRLERASLEAIFKSAPVGLSLSEAPSGRSILINDEMQRILGQKIAGPDLSRYLLMGAVHPDGRPYDLQHYPPVRSILHGEEVRAEPIILVRPDGSRERAEISSTPIRLGTAGIDASVTVLVDVEAREQALEHQRLITDELAHRMKNTLAMVQAIVSQTLRSSTSIVDARAEVLARLAALSRAQDALTRASWTSATLADTVAAALEPLALSPECLSVDGPEVRLGSRAALSFTLTLHELATNAVKYGALSSPSGRVIIRWALEPELDGRQLSFTWTEVGGPAVTPPERRGFGSRLIASVSKTFAGESSLQFEPAGVCWKVTAQVEALSAF